ncbi:sensor domain-containing protein [Actinomycetaceae bacterium MB13-C1-2]|nr:sensor domain-containing protein [Actinomycetaceae bacterium MB13-C1-2]
MPRTASITTQPNNLTSPATKPPQRDLWPTYGILWRWTPGSLLFTVAGFALSLASFIVLVTLLSTGIATLIIWIGVPLIVGALFAARGFATAHCYLLRLTGLPQISAPDWNRGSPAAPTWWGRLIRALRGGHYWMALLHGLMVSPIITLASFIIGVLWASVAIFGSLEWLLRLINPSIVSDIWGRHISDAMPWLFGSLPPWVIEDVLYLVIGAIFLAVAPWVFRGLSWVNWIVAKAMLGHWPSDDLAAEARAEQLARTAAVRAENDSLRRLERDIHDGPQQQLLRVQLDLATLVRRVEAGDIEAVSTLAVEAQSHAKAALDELRALSAGVAPPLTPGPRPRRRNRSLGREHTPTCDH